MGCEWSDNIFSVNEGNFRQMALEVFRFQYENNDVYRAFANALGKNPEKVSDVAGIPYLPISLFKTHEVKTGAFDPEITFTSSGTTQTGNSRHFLKNVEVYKRSFRKGFELFYGNINEWCILGLLPSYLERKDSSLVFMVNQLIKDSGHMQSGFYLDEHKELIRVLQSLKNSDQKTLLIGVSFALLDLSEKFSIDMSHVTIMETGGMKGRRKEITRKELHEKLKEPFKVNSIHSEYGMTELLSQAYSRGEGIFNAPPWMKILVRDEEDPLSVREEGRGVINVIDLANVYSCAFIATDDAARLKLDGSFEVLGRVDASEVRGCSLMLEEGL